MTGTARPVLDRASLPPLFVIRHGQTAWNAERRLQGWIDTPLTDFGREQADRNGTRLKGLIRDPLAFDYVASPLSRARETLARIRKALDLDPETFRTDARLRELHFGAWQGLTYPEVEAREPGRTALREADRWNFTPPGEGGESLAALSLRVAPLLAELRAPTICVTHGGVVRVLLDLLGVLGRDEAARLAIPQDRVLRLADGRADWL